MLHSSSSHSTKKEEEEKGFFFWGGGREGGRGREKEVMWKNAGGERERETDRQRDREREREEEGGAIVRRQTPFACTVVVVVFTKERNAHYESLSFFSWGGRRFIVPPKKKFRGKPVSRNIN